MEKEVSIEPAVGIRGKYCGRHETLIEVRVGVPVKTPIEGSGCFHERSKFVRFEVNSLEQARQCGFALDVVRAVELKGRGSSSTDCWVDRLKPVGSEDHDGREVLFGQAVDPADEGVHAGAVFMVHLGCFAGLR
jgi:hypothetical protein